MYGYGLGRVTIFLPVQTYDARLEESKTSIRKSIYKIGLSFKENIFEALKLLGLGSPNLSACVLESLGQYLVCINFWGMQPHFQGQQGSLPLKFALADKF